VADKVIVSGCSAGGLASFTWVQTIRELLPSTVTVLKYTLIIL
jgi:acetyl esterase/lipase